MIEGRGRSLRAVRLFRLRKNHDPSINPLPTDTGFGPAQGPTPPVSAEGPSPDHSAIYPICNRYSSLTPLPPNPAQPVHPTR